MPIQVENHRNYGGDLVTQKYSPLVINNTPIDNANENAFKKLFNDRVARLVGQGIFPRRLTFRTANWDTIQRNEANANSLPPLVVVSSNRAAWIHGIWDNTDQIQNGNYAGVNDRGALVAGASPWYSPKRINDPNRHVYIFVHDVEYPKYAAAMVGTGMTVVGWSFDINNYVTPDGILPRERTYVGFGATRYAAIEFCKHIFNVRFNALDPATVNIPLAANRQKAWLVDDNVAYVSGFPGFANCEAEINNNVWGLGFTGATRNSSDLEITNLGNANAAPLGVALANNDYLLQQCTLWNIHQLNTRYLNFSPYFITSAEDTSFSSYLINDNPSKARFARAARVVKAVIPGGAYDNDAGYRKLARLRDTDVTNYYDDERTTPVEPRGNQPPTPSILHDYISDYVLPNSNNEREWSVYTESKAVEQILSRVVAQRRAWAPDEIFKPNGDNAQVIRRL